MTNVVGIGNVVVMYIQPHHTHLPRFFVYKKYKYIQLLRKITWLCMELYLYYIRRIKPNYRRISQEDQTEMAGGSGRRIRPEG